MLHALRNSVNSLGAKILLGLLVLAFAAWGLEGVFAARTQTVAATVGKAEIQIQDFAREFDGRLRSLRQTTGSSLTAEDARRSGFDQIILSQMATETALSEEAKALGLDASDTAVSEAIVSAPQFLDAYGKFDRTAYDATLSRNGLRQNQYEESIRNDLARDAMLQSIGNGTTAPRALAEALYKYRNEKRAFEYIALSPSDVDEPGEPSDEQLSTYHEENAARFTAPEFRKVSYVALTIAEVAAGLDRSDQELRVEYNSRIDAYTTPERRDIEQIVFDSEEEAKEAAQKIADGEPFAKLAEARGLSANDVSLGVQTRAELPGALADAAFSAEKPGIADPIGTALGWSLLNIRSIEPENVVTFEEAKEDLRRELTTTEARQLVPEYSIDMDDELSGGSTLLETAKASNGRFSEVAAVDATGRDPEGERVPDLPRDPILLTSIFDAEVGDEPSLIEGSTGDYFAVVVEEVTPSALRPLDTVRDDVSGAWEVSQREAALEELTESLVKEIEGGATLAELAEERGLDVASAGPGTRTDRSLGLSPELLTQLFEADKDKPLQGSASNGLERLVGTVTEIETATSEEDVTAIDRSTEAYAARLAQDFVDQFSRTARDSHPFQPNPLALEALFTGQGGYGGGHGGGY